MERENNLLPYHTGTRTEVRGTLLPRSSGTYDTKTQTQHRCAVLLVNTSQMPVVISFISRSETPTVGAAGKWSGQVRLGNRHLFSFYSK